MLNYLTFTEETQDSYPVCFLTTALNYDIIEKECVDTHLPADRDKFVAFELHTEGKKTPIKVQKEFLDELLPNLEKINVKYLIVSDAGYFKTLTKQVKAEPFLGYVLPCDLNPSFNVIYCPSLATIFYDPEKIRAKVAQAFEALTDHVSNSYVDPGDGIIKTCHYPQTVTEIREWLIYLRELNKPLASDIEGFSLKHYSAGIGTISFAWSKHEGIAFPVDLLENENDRTKVRNLLKEFFTLFKNKMIWHNISYDVYVLIYQLFMNDLLDTEGLLQGLEVMLNNWDDTKLITYLATNSCAGNELSLKIQAQEFSGNYAVEEIEDITKIPLPKLLEYNLVDALSTWYVYEKHWDTLVNDQQLDIYENFFKPNIWDIIQMQLTGFPLDMDQVIKVNEVLTDIAESSLKTILNNDWIVEYTEHKKEQIVIDKNSKYKVKRITVADVDYEFNPNSPDQLQELLFEKQFLNLPILERTPKGNSSTGGEILSNLLNHTKDKQALELLSALIEFKAVYKIITAFMPPMLNAPQAPDGHHYLYGNFNLGGTISGRLSSSNPNLQNLPANVNMILDQATLDKWSHIIGLYVKKGKLSLGKLIKSCFIAASGWQLVGLDFASLEDRISALTTRDPNKLKVYTDGYDGHCLRAFAYFGDQMTGIIDGNVDSINSIADLYPALRQDSKAPTFALTYQGTFKTLIKNCGFTTALAIKIESSYHELYKVSDEWVSDKLNQASRDGYITVAFGLRVRTPLLKQVVRGNKKTPFEAEAEGRTAGNALGQSWCMLNGRAAMAFMKKVRSSKYRLSIKPCGQIHDAQYYLIRDDIDILHYMNTELVKEVKWQDDPLIYHDEVKLGGELSVFYPSWAEEVSISNDATIPQIRTTLRKHLDTLG